MNMLKSAAIEMRNEGYSYSAIHKKLGIPLSTLSSWFRGKPFTPNDETIRNSTEGRLKYGAVKSRQRLESITFLNSIAKQEIGDVSSRDLWMFGIGLWLGEGSKTTEQIRLANSDPRTIGLWVEWLRKICGLKNENITARMHLYPDSDEVKARIFWCDVTGLMPENFKKSIVDYREKNQNKSGKSQHGTLHVSVVSAGDKSKGVELHRRMLGWLSGIIENKRV